MRTDNVVTAGERYAIAVVGAGPAGIMAAARAVSRARSVLLLDHSKHASLKLGLTGKGRCNFTNARPISQFVEKIPRGSRFLQPAFHELSNEALIAQFEELGIEVEVGAGLRVYPSNMDAVGLRRRLVKWLQDLGVELRTQSHVTAILPLGEGGFELSVEMPDGQEARIVAQRVILATGGMSYPSTGSDGSGFELARQLGHTVTPLRPSLAPIYVGKPLAGVPNRFELKNTRLSLVCDGKEVDAQRGDLELIPKGFGGPIARQLSRSLADRSELGTCQLFLDLKPALSKVKLAARLKRESQQRPHEPFKTALGALLPRPLILPFLRQLNLSPKTTWRGLSPEHFSSLLEGLKSLPFTITGMGGFDEAIVTVGGVALEEIDPNAMQSALVPGLYFAGEMIDTDAHTGGFNLQIAFSTGALAGRSAAEK